MKCCVVDSIPRRVLASDKPALTLDSMSQSYAFGYANLNNDLLAEWGYISVDELLDEDWKPCKYRDATNTIEQERTPTPR
jgi:hypothetical protein